MSANKREPVRFSLLTVFVWLLVAGGAIFLLWQVINRISGGDLPGSLLSGTNSPNQTQVNQTIAAILTAQPSSLPATQPKTDAPPSAAIRTQTPAILLPTPHSTSTQTASLKTVTPKALCNQAAAGNPIDVTIPDDSLIPPGQSFIKTWKLVNAGICTWTIAYTANFFYGDRMGAPETVPLQEGVLPAESVEISVEMVAPTEPGTYQGNWKLANATGVLFGIGPNGDAPFWVRIIVQDLTATPTATSGITATRTPTNAITSTPTPEGQISGKLELSPGDTIDLDQLTVNKGAGDLVYQVDSHQYHWLTPHETAMIGVYGKQLPGLEDCQSANMSSAPIAVESLAVDTYLCYHTEEERSGRMLLEAVHPNDFVLTLDLLTWARP